MIYDYWCWPWPLFVRFLQGKVILSVPFPCCILLKEVTLGLHLTSGGLCFNSSRADICIKYLELFCVGDLSVLSYLLTYLIIYVYQYGLADIDSILWVKIHYYLMVLLIPLWAIGGAVLLLTPISLWHSHITVHFFFLSFWCYKMVQVYRLYFLSQSWNQSFLQGALAIFIGEWC